MGCVPRSWDALPPYDFVLIRAIHLRVSMLGQGEEWGERVNRSAPAASAASIFSLPSFPFAALPTFPSCPHGHICRHTQKGGKEEGGRREISAGCGGAMRVQGTRAYILLPHCAAANDFPPLSPFRYRVPQKGLSQVAPAETLHLKNVKY